MQDETTGNDGTADQQRVTVKGTLARKLHQCYTGITVWQLNNYLYEEELS